MEILYHVFVFFAMTVTDFVWTDWAKSVSEKKALRAGLMSIGTVLCGAFVVTAYVSDPTYVVSAALGAFFGTWLSVKFRK